MSRLTDELMNSAPWANTEERAEWWRNKCYEIFEELEHYRYLEEQGRLIDWRKTSEEKPDSTRHLIAAYGEIISHYAYYLKPKDKWFTDWTCEKELDAPIFWADMPDPPEESLHNDCVAKLAELKGTEE